LTEAGNARFPDAHGELTAQLIHSIRTQLGEAVLERLIDSRSAESKANYATALEGASDLGERVSRLARARAREGYMAESWAEGDGYVLVENHCPICVAATACQAFCRSELDTFREVLGPGVSVERTEHITAGDRRCVYHITSGSRTARRRGTSKKDVGSCGEFGGATRRAEAEPSSSAPRTPDPPGISGMLSA
jgi:predicted ArsR family transcriptional regulator